MFGDFTTVHYYLPKFKVACTKIHGDIASQCCNNGYVQILGVKNLRKGFVKANIEGNTEKNYKNHNKLKHVPEKFK